MLKIQYPKANLKRFEKKYLDAFNNIANLNRRLKTFFSSDPKFAPLRKHSASEILTMPIAELYNLTENLDALALTDREKATLSRIFNYDKNGKDKFKLAYGKKHQPLIAHFFEKQSELELQTCFFCNIDHINIINDLYDYANFEDFYNRGSFEQFQIIRDIGDKTAKSLIKDRKDKKTFNETSLTGKQRANFKSFTINEKYNHNHFTLDHMLGKERHPIAALSLYNFVPSCYSCNTKFKNDKTLIENINDLHLSPTSDLFDFQDKIRFKIFFPLDKTKTYLAIKVPDDFVLEYEIDGGGENYNKYIDLFKLRSRYIFHKREVAKLVNKRKNYTGARITELSNLTGQSEEYVERQIFGEELYNRAYDYSPLTKFKRDIAKDIGLKNVL